jgi:hypothetical protein
LDSHRARNRHAARLPKFDPSPALID